MKKEKDEISTSGGAGGYMSPFIFDPKSNPKQKKKKRKRKGKCKKIEEDTYNNYRKDNTKTTKRKIDNNIQLINKNLINIDRLLSHANKLKSEMDVDSRKYLKPTTAKLSKINKQINLINLKLKNL